VRVHNQESNIALYNYSIARWEPRAIRAHNGSLVQHTGDPDWRFDSERQQDLDSQSLPVLPRPGQDNRGCNKGCLRQERDIQHVVGPCRPLRPYHLVKVQGGRTEYAGR